jgi:hypothetical protein
MKPTTSGSDRLPIHQQQRDTTHTSPSQTTNATGTYHTKPSDQTTNHTIQLSPQHTNRQHQVDHHNPARSGLNSSTSSTKTTGTNPIQITLSHANSNENIHVGDPMQQDKPPNTIRLYFQNINGINKNNWSDWTEAARNIKQANIDIFGCPETNIWWTEEKRKYAQYIIQTHLKQANMSVAGSSEGSITNYQPGGVTNCIAGKYTGRIIEHIHDESGLGRWAGHVLLGTNNKNIVILTAYRPTKSDGFNTTYQQQWRILRTQHHPNPDPREQMMTDLQKTIELWVSKQSEVILMWDANERMDHHTSKLIRFMTKTSLAPCHINLPRATYARGSSCIDFIMATPGAREAITAAGYTSFYHGIWHSDHRGVFIDFSSSLLFHGTTPDIAHRPGRQVKSQNKKQVFRFIKALEKAGRLPQLLSDIEQLSSQPSWNTDDHKALEEIDIQFTKYLLQAEAECSLPHQADWHPQLHHSYLILRYWKIKLAGKMNHIHIDKQLHTTAEKLRQLNIDPNQNNANRSILSQLKIAKKNLQIQRSTAIDKRQQHLSFRQEVLVLEGKKDRKAAVATIQRAERRARCFRKFHTYTRQPRSPHGLAYVIKTNAKGEQNRIQQPDELQETLFERNRLHFAQADGTPFTRHPLSTTLTFSGIS